MHPQVTHTHTHSLTQTRLSQSCIRFVFVTDLCAVANAKSQNGNTHVTLGVATAVPPLFSALLPPLLPDGCVTQISPAGKTSLLIHNSIGARRALLFACDLTSIFPVVFFVRFILPTFPPSCTFSSLKSTFPPICPFSNFPIYCCNSIRRRVTNFSICVCKRQLLSLPFSLSVPPLPLPICGCNLVELVATLN